MFHTPRFDGAFLIRQVQQAAWTIQRYSRHQTVAIDRRFRESLEFQQKRKQLQKARREALAKEIAERSGRPVSDLQRLIDLDVTTVSAVQEADEISRAHRANSITTARLRRVSSFTHNSIN